ncbi:TPA: HigA family addiction module antitoxin [Pseudomonas aeruginosa]|uniref:HigA family addiction module antitoxin n=1 Tax=Pseudomonas aeruginosa TaxID=287 RepID=UPI00053D52C4|nr:HigA family addiction module antitoxin [Pseudomonas aeruginosa]EME5359051.1 HigA family addiction module antidote protein [Pseudomonas aeruginosa]MCO5623825.1 HigA family addiction module antidote protein [Pseudomonas aeruginosa]MDY1173889.1 HigA family addiction module antitoxin [Pseudomonas aeruginosa]GLF13193.1 transcriptional regulator [Pseudomonas aeruginosa]HBO6790389.1 HigA family addiction module antidote protein [Pseudomonas aeruginosa]
MIANGMRPVHPGEVLREEFMHPLDLTENDLSKRLHVSASTIKEIVSEKKSLTADVALRLARLFDTTPSFWMNLQAQYALKKAEIDHGPDILKQVEPFQAMA